MFSLQQLVKTRSAGRIICCEARWTSLATNQICITAISTRNCKSYWLGSRTLLKTPGKNVLSVGVPLAGNLHNKRATQKENIWTIPNILCMSRIVATPVIIYLFCNDNFKLAIGLLFAAGITDLLDGKIARQFPSQKTVMGTFLDPLADKILVGSLYLCLTWLQLIPVPLTSLIIFRDVGLVSAAFYLRYISLPPPKTFKRYFDITYPTAKIAPTFLSKLNTATQLSLLLLTVSSPFLPFDSNSYLPYAWYFCGATTVASGLSYIFASKTYRILAKSS